MYAKSITMIYLKSLAWILLFIAAAASTYIIFIPVFADFFHGNTSRPLSDTLALIFVIAPILAFIMTIFALLVLAVPQFFEALLTWMMIRKIGDKGGFVTLIALPATAVLTWYCYDYILPHKLLDIGGYPEWEPYEHGLSLYRFGAVFLAQAFVTLFNFCYLQCQVRQFPKKNVILPVLVLALIAGCLLGYFSARGQYQYL